MAIPAMFWSVPRLLWTLTVDVLTGEHEQQWVTAVLEHLAYMRPSCKVMGGHHTSGGHRKAAHEPSYALYAAEGQSPFSGTEGWNPRRESDKRRSGFLERLGCASDTLDSSNHSD